MTLPISILVLIAGFFILIKGAGWLVDGASSIARIFGASDLMIGLTIVAFGTSMPELLVNIIASAQGNADIAIGNVVGSNIANTLLALGMAAMIAPLVVRTSTVRKEIPLSILASIALIIVVNDSFIDGSFTASQISRSEGMTLMLFFGIFLYYTFGLRKNENEGHSKEKKNPIFAIAFIFLGCLLLPLGGKLVVDASSSIAKAIGFSEAFIGLSLVALGTSLPEVVTACMAVYKGKVDIAVGNVVGSNIFNIFWILGISAIIRPIQFNPILNVDLLLVTASSLLLFYLVHNGPVHRRIFFWKNPKEYKILKSEGVVLLVLYVLYLVYIGWRG